MYRVLTAILVLILVAGDTGARGYSSRSSSSSRSYSRSYSRPSSKPTPTKRSSNTSFSKKKTSTAKPKAVARTKTSKALQKKNATASKKYGNKSNATKAYRQENKAKLESLANKKYDTKPETRPEHIPAQYSGPNGQAYPTTFHNGYYGYMDPVSNAFMQYAVADMIVTNAMLRSSGYGHYNATGQPVVVHTGPGAVIGWIIGAIVIVVLIIVIGVMASA